MSETPEQKAESLAEPFEGFSARPYLDTMANPPVVTQGFGSTTRNGDGKTPIRLTDPPISLSIARLWMANELHRVVAAVAESVRVWLTIDQVAALADLVYNIGIGAFRSSTLLKKLNAGDYEGAAAEIDRWNHSGGVVVAGLLRRRMAETTLFKTPDKTTGDNA